MFNCNENNWYNILSIYFAYQDCSGQTQTELTKDISPLSLTTYIGLNVTSYPVQLLNKVYKQQVFLAILYFG